MKPIIVNLYDAPYELYSNSVSSDIAATYVYAMLKMKGVNCGLILGQSPYGDVPRNYDNFINFSNTAAKINYIKNKVDVIINANPLPLCVFYNGANEDKNFEKIVFNTTNSYCNYNYLLMRQNSCSYNEEIDILEDEIQDFLDSKGITYIQGLGDKKFYNYIVDTTYNLLSKEKEN